MADLIHRIISKQGYSVEEIESIVEGEEQKFLSDLGEKLGEPAEELAADIEFGEDVILEFEVLEIEEAGG